MTATRARSACGRARGEEFYEIVVADDGPGIRPEHRERVFGLFQTLRSRDEVEGSGMGLAMVKRQIEAVVGQIWVTDVPDGRGTEMHFTWPTAWPATLVKTPEAAAAVA